MTVIQKNITVQQYTHTSAQATAAKVAAQTAQTAAELAETNAETAQGLAEAARDTAVTARNQLQPILTNLARLLAVSDDLTEINAVYAKLTEISAVYADLANIDIVAGDTIQLNAIYNSLTELLALHAQLVKLVELHTELPELLALHAQLTKLTALYDNLTGLVAIYDNLAAILNLNSNLDHVTTVEAALTAITTVSDAIANVNTVAGSIADVTTVATDLDLGAASKTKIVAENIADVQTAADNIAAIQAAPTHATTATTQAGIATDKAAEASGHADDAETAQAAAEAAQAKAQEWAEEAEDVEVEAGQYSAKHWAKKSEDYAIDAARYYSWYGYRVYLTIDGSPNYSSDVERIGNTDLHKSLPIQSGLRRYLETPEGEFVCWLNSNDSRLREDNGDVADLTGASGNVMLFKPGYWFKLETNLTATNPYVDRKFSTTYQEGWQYRLPRSISPWYATFDNVNNRVASVCSLIFNTDGSLQRDAVTDLPDTAANAAQFRGGNNNAARDNTYQTDLGMARTNVNRATIMGYHYGDLTSATGGVMTELAQLFTLEYATYNSQAAYNAALTAEGFKQGGLGNGPAVASAEWSTHNSYYPFVPNGVTVPLGNSTGQVTYSIKNWQNSGTDKDVTITSWHGFEGWFEYLWLINTDHLVYHQSDVTGGKVHLYVCDDYTKLANPASEQTDGAAPVVPDGYELRSVDLPNANGYGWNEVANTAGDMYPINTQGSATQGLCDYYYRNAADRGWFAPLLAGAANNGSNAGVRVANTYYRVSSAFASSGFRLCRHTPQID